MAPVATLLQVFGGDLVARLECIAGHFQALRASSLSLGQRDSRLAVVVHLDFTALNQGASGFR
jgi:hypothetical protein